MIIPCIRLSRAIWSTMHRTGHGHDCTIGNICVWFLLFFFFSKGWYSAKT